MENKITLYGASGHCKVILDIILLNNIGVNYIIDDNPNSNYLLEFSITKSEDVNINEIKNFIISIGNNKIRKFISNKLPNSFANAIHPDAVVSKFSYVSIGTVVMAGAVINSESKIGKHCIINTGAIVEHDCIVEDFVHIAPKAAIAGGVIVREGSHVGIGASVLQGIRIGKWATIGAGTVIISDVPDFAVVVGNPGKIIKYNENNE